MYVRMYLFIVACCPLRPILLRKDINVCSRSLYLLLELEFYVVSSVGILSAVCVRMCVYILCWMCVYIHIGVGTLYRLATCFQGSHSNTASTLRPIQLARCVHSQLALRAASSCSYPLSPPKCLPMY